MKHPVRFDAPPQDESDYWSDVHEQGYDETVFSVTQDPAILGEVMGVLRREPTRDILIPGCGSFVHLQQAILTEMAPSLTSMVCTDFERVAAQASRALQAPQIRFEGVPTQDLPFSEQFDAAVVINSIVSADDALNRSMIRRIHAALRPGGRLIGLFPTVFTDVDLLSLGHDNQPVIDVRRNLIFESAQGVWQLAYSPLRLRLILREAGFELTQMRIVFLESKAFMAQAEAQYGITDPDLPIWELLVEARRSRKACP
jgi:SAM-dependent methyltransferase